MSAFDFSTFEDFFKDVLKAHDKDRGYRSRLAVAARVHPSYITRICNGTASITPDQAAALAEFWGLETSEKEYFLWLVLRGRSGDPAMIKLATGRLEQLKAIHEDLGQSLSAEKVDPVQENEYYMNWVYSAVHVLATLKEPQVMEQVARRLGLQDSMVKLVSMKLEKMGLIKIKHGKVLTATQKNIHLSNQSWMASLQHRNWRVWALDKMGRPAKDDVRYTGVHSISKKDLEKLRRQIREFLIQADKLIRPSAEETACVLSLDLMEL